jgi:fructose transport system substrate-binding protein
MGTHVKCKRRRGSMNRTSARVLALAATAAFATGVSACGGDGGGGGGGGGGEEKEEVIVGLITKTESNPFFVKMKEGASAAAKTAGVELTSAAGKSDNDNQAQVAAIESMVSRGAKGILITPADSKAIVPAIKKARDAGVLVIALDTPTEPREAADALFATDNLKAGELIGQYAKAKAEEEGIEPKIAMLDLAPGISVGQLRHDGFLKGFGIKEGAPEIAGAADTLGETAKGQTAMETLLQKEPDINIVYSINEPSGFGGATALKQAGKEAMILSVDGGCNAITKGIKTGVIDATSQQYPLKMAELGVKAVADFAETGKKPSGYVDTGVTLITDDPAEGVPSKDSKYGLENCWG